MSSSFVKRGVLQSDDGGNTFNVEVDEPTTTTTTNTTTTSTKVSLYDQLAKTVNDRRTQKVEGRPEELTIEDQEFVNRIMSQKDQEARTVEEETKEFKRQRMLVSTSSSTSNATLMEPILQNNKSVESETVIIVKKKKKKPGDIPPQ